MVETDPKQTITQINCKTATGTSDAEERSMAFGELVAGRTLVEVRAGFSQLRPQDQWGNREMAVGGGHGAGHMETENSKEAGG